MPLSTGELNARWGGGGGSYKHFDINAFKRDLEGVPWHGVENEDNIDDAVCTWNKLFSDIADSHAPVKRRRVRGALLPWMNTKINEAMQDRDYHHRKAIRLIASLIETLDGLASGHTASRGSRNTPGRFML